jgi:TorA maturation chaperone TorD
MNSRMITSSELSKIFSLLSSLYLCRPSRDALENWRILLSGDVSDFMLDLKDALDEIDLKSERELKDLIWEYTRLFIGPYKLPCPPWESVYTSPKKLLMQDAYDEVKNSYDELGLMINNPDILPDHIGAELNFLAVLFQKIDSEPEKRLSHINIAKRFCDDHLMKWIPQFTRDMEEAANILFYETLARVTRTFTITAIRQLVLLV